VKSEELDETQEDEPSSIVENAITEQRRMLSGYWGNPQIERQILEEAWNPIHCAMSLVGEPTLYSRLGQLIREFFKRKFRTIFLVTNGMFPEVLAKLNPEPSQLYVSLCAPDRATYEKVCRPQLHDAWLRVNDTLKLLESFRCPTVIRITLAKGLNMTGLKDYAKLVSKANPTYLEPKGAMAVGFFNRRLPRNMMPTFEDVRIFAKELSALTGYGILEESSLSNVLLLSRLNRPMRLAN